MEDHMVEIALDEPCKESWSDTLGHRIDE